MKRTDHNSLWMMPARRAARVLVGLLCLSGWVRGADDLAAFLDKLSSSNGDERRAAWESAAPQGAAAIEALAELASGDSRDTAVAALRAIDRIAHSSAAPGSATRADVAKAMALVADDAEASVRVRQHVLELLGSVGGDEVVPVLRKILDHEIVQEDARKALERIPGDAASLALMDAVGPARGPWRDSLLITLGTRKATCCIRDIGRIAMSPGEGRVAAAKALARIGDPATVTLIIGAIRASEPPASRELTDDLVHMADTIYKTGNESLATRIYTSVLANAVDDAPRYAAVYALAALDPHESFPVLLDAAGDRSPRIRDFALQCLIRAEGDDVNDRLLAKYDEATSRKKAALLRVIVAREIPEGKKLVDAALADEDIDVQVTALDLAGTVGDAKNVPVLLAAFEKGSPAVKDVALNAYLGIADARRTDDAALSQTMYLRVLEMAGDPRSKSRALLGLAAIGDPAQLPTVEAARKDADLAAAANEAYVAMALAIGKGDDKEKAKAMLVDVLAAGASRETMQRAMAGLQELGGDPTAFQKKQGLLASWYVVGPFPNDGGRGFDTEYSPEKGIDLTEQIDPRGRKRKWAEFHSTNLDGKVDLRQVFQRSNDVCAYAYTEIEIPEARDVKLKMGSDDGVVCWLNGQKVHSNNATRPCSVDSDVVDAQLKSGKNTILLKITQGGGEWEFTFRIADRDGKGIDLTPFKTLLSGQP